MKTEFEKRMYRVCEKLGATPELLAILGSYKDTQPDDTIISMLDDWLLGLPTFRKTITGSDEHFNVN